MVRTSLLLAVVAVWAAGAAAQSTFDLDDITCWVGTGSNRAAVVIDWFENSTADEALVWGYRWDGSATSEDMILAVLAADDRLYAKVINFSFGKFINGIGFDLNDNGVFGLDDGTVFDSAGIAITDGSDLAAPTDPGDVYFEGYFTAFWNFSIASTSPFAGGSWETAQVGISDRALADGSWDGYAFTPTFAEARPENPANACVPEASSLLLVAGAFAAVLFVKRRAVGAALLVALAGTATVASAASPFASEVVSYSPGSAVGVANPAPYQTDGSQALGAPARDAGFGSQVGVFYGPFRSSDLTIIGAGGELVVKFDHLVLDHHLNPFGVDLLVFGNAFFTRNAEGEAAGILSEPGRIAVSLDGIEWVDVPSVTADGLYPTLGYQDTAYNGSGSFGGTTLTDFTLPVDPSFDPFGKTEAEINSAYAGSGGGAGVDIGALGLSAIQYVKVYQRQADNFSTEIDAFADVAAVPEPSSFVLAAVSAAGFSVLYRSRRGA